MSTRIDANSRFNEFFMVNRVPYQSWMIFKVKTQPSNDLACRGQFRFDKKSTQKEGGALIITQKTLDEQLKTKLTLGFEATKLSFLVKPKKFNQEGDSKLQIKRWISLQGQ